MAAAKCWENMTIFVATHWQKHDDWGVYIKAAIDKYANKYNLHVRINDYMILSYMFMMESFKDKK